MGAITYNFALPSNTGEYKAPVNPGTGIAYGMPTGSTNLGGWGALPSYGGTGSTGTTGSTGGNTSTNPFVVGGSNPGTGMVGSPGVPATPNPTNPTQSPIAPNGSTLDPSQSTLSPNFDQYVYNMLGRGEQAANAPFQYFQGDRYAGPSDLQTQAFQGIGSLSLPGQFGQASNAYNQVLGGSMYDASDPSTVAKFMSPYQQNVIDINKREAVRQDDIARNSRNAQAVGAGAFGGSRQGIQEAEAGRNLSTQLGDIQAKGNQSAYDAAMAAINAARTGSLTAAQGLGSLGTAQNNAQLGNLGAQTTAGGIQNQLEQQPLDFGYQQWQDSINYPQKQAENMQKLLQGLPLAANTYSSGDSAINSLLSGGLGALSLFNLFGK